MSLAIDDLAAFVGGVVAGEGNFARTGRAGAVKWRFTFQIGLGAVDTITCETVRDVLGIGSLVFSPRRKPHYDDEIALHVRRLRDLVEIVVPFMDEHLPPSYKRVQYLQWRAALLDYWENSAKRRRPCAVEGCDRSRRAKGLCRRHYYEAYGA